MILSKQFLNDQIQKRAITENFLYGNFFYNRKKLETYDVFISYSFRDQYYADKIVQLLEKCGYTVYIDYNDNRLDRSNVSEYTAKQIVREMNKCKGLLHLYSPNASISKWCPWEVGIFSGMKNFKCANLPLTEKQGEDFKKQEYLEIYPYVEYSRVRSTYGNEFFVHNGQYQYVTLKEWLNDR